MTKKLILDFDNTIVNTTKAFVDTYNLIAGKKYVYGDTTPPQWEKVRRYDFLDEIPQLKKEEKFAIFNTRSLHDNLEYYDNALEIVRELSEKVEVHIVSMCSYESAIIKGEMLERDLPNTLFQPIIFTHFKDKSHIDMRNGIFLDDVSRNLRSSSADKKICFRYKGVVMDVNETWQGDVLTRWDDKTYKYIKELLEVK